MPIEPTAPVVAFSLFPSSTFQFVGLAEGTIGPQGALPQVAYFTFDFQDMSVDTPVGGNTPATRTLKFTTEWEGGVQPGPTWRFVPPLDMSSIKPGERKTGFQLFVLHEPLETVKDAVVRVTANLSIDQEYQGRKLYALRNETFHVRIYPTPGVQVELVRPPLTAKPNAFTTLHVRVANTDLYPQNVDLRLILQAAEGVEPDSMPVTGTGTYLLEPLEQRDFNITFRTPKERFWYNSVPVLYTVRVNNAENEAIAQAFPGSLIVDGFYISRQVLIIIPIFILLAILFVFLLLAARRYYNERILGKPIPPWRIPEEAAALQELRKADPRAFYLRRYFFMEEEYQSALDWFHSFKKRTRRQLAAQAAAAKYEEKATALAEPSLTRFDRRAVRLEKRFRARQERQRLKLEAKLEKLQAKLDQHYEEDYEKDHAKWEKKVDKIKKKANKPWYKAHKKWEAEVAKIEKEWEKPFRKEKEKADKERAKALEKYERKVKKADKEAWRDWREAVENAERENKIRKKEGREPVPMPELLSKEVGPPELPPAFKAPPKPKLPPEPKEPTDIELPPEPELDKPKLEASHYARKARRARRKTDRKVRRLERKLERALAKNERDRVRALAKADRKRNKLIHKREEVFEPSIRERIFRLTPEHREYRARRKLMKALAKERLRQVEESEKTRLEVMRVDAERREAELLAKLIRDRSASVRSGNAPSGMKIAPDKDPQLVGLRQKNEAQLAKERQASQARLKAESARIEKELRANLTEELIKERARSRPPAAAEAEPAKPKKK